MNPKNQRPEITSVTNFGFKEPADNNKRRPKFCLQHLDPDFDIKGSGDKNKTTAFAEQLQSLASMTWQEIIQSQRKGLGSETIVLPVRNLKIPARFEDRDRILAFRYHGKLPMLGFREADTLYVIGLARDFSDFYDH